MQRFYGLGALTFCAAAACALLVYPLTIIQPFKHQAADALQRALWVFRIAPPVTIGISIAAILLVIGCWRLWRWPGRSAAVVLLLLTCAATLAARIYIFELMFHPAGAPAFVAAEKAKIDPADMLITVAVNGDARAYPIREMGYHHVVNDVAGGVPIVATY